MSSARYGLVYTLLRGMRVAKPLDLIHYEKVLAIGELAKACGWQYYGGKHFESRWTRFFQGWWLPKRFGYDKRLAHLSSLILSGQLTRDDALLEMEAQPYTDEMMREDQELILRKLEMPPSEWAAMLNAPLCGHEAYPRSEWIPKLLTTGRNVLRRAGLLR
jgi:hypothetical protein